MPTLCPLCQSNNIIRSKRRGLLESVFFKLIHVRPYRCQSCDWRFFRRGVPHGQRTSHLVTASTPTDVQGAISRLSEGPQAVDRALMGQKTAGSESAFERG
jgi:hypothetical protein